MYSQAMDALHLLLYQFHQSPTIGVPFYRKLMDFGGFGMVCSPNALGVRVKIYIILSLLNFYKRHGTCTCEHFDKINVSACI